MRWPLYTAFGVVVLVGGSWAAGLTWNATGSMPRGLWVERTEHSALHRGDVVSVCVESSDTVKRYVGPGDCQGTRLEPLLKPVAAIAGDRVAVSDQGVSVNGQLIAHSKPRLTDGQGRALPHLVQMEVHVAMGHVWLVAPMDDSFDSRYLGPVSTTAVIGEMTPLLTE
jgi:conjugative transfer signal peptidase TraF